MKPFDSNENNTTDIPNIGNNKIEFPDFPEETSEEKTQDMPTIEEPKIDFSMYEDVSGGSNVPPETPKKPKRGEFKKNPKVINIALTIIAVIANILITLVMFNITRFASISQNIFLMINIATLALLIILDLLVILMIRTRKIALFVISVLVLSLFVATGGYGVYALGRINKNVNKITGDTKEQEVAASLVIYSGTSGDPITDVKSLDGRRVGISSGSQTAEIAKKKLSSENVTPEYVEVSGYTELLTQLISGGVDCAVLPVSYQSQFADDENLSAYLADTKSILDFSETVTSTSAAGADKDITKEPFTVLVTGENEGLADSIILMSVNPISMKVTMTSIARDSYVPISCYGSSDKINSAHAASEECMVKTVENLMGIDIDYTIEFNFASVIQVVDAVGGVDVENDTAFLGQSWNLDTDKLEVVPIPYGEGLVHMNGQQALGFVRERYAFADGDFARQRHQQAVIENIIQKVMQSKDPQMFLDILDAAGDNIKTNFTVDQMTGFINYALQKSARYYNTNDIAGVFNFESSRVTGYSAYLWNSSLQMELWIYRLFNGSIEDCAKAIKRNLDLDETPTTPTTVSWSAVDTYTPDPVSQEEYNETRITDSGKPVETPDYSNTDDNDTYTPPTPTPDYSGSEETYTPPTATPEQTEQTEPTEPTEPTPEQTEPTEPTNPDPAVPEGTEGVAQ